MHASPSQLGAQFPLMAHSGPTGWRSTTSATDPEHTRRGAFDFDQHAFALSSTFVDLAQTRRCGRSSVHSDLPAIIGPVQQRLSLSRAAALIARLAIASDLCDVAANCLPASDLPGVLFRHAPAHVVAAIPLKPAARIVGMNPALSHAIPTGAGWHSLRNSSVSSRGAPATVWLA